MRHDINSPFLPGFLTTIRPQNPRGPSVVSELVSFENKRGMRIVGFHDFSRTNSDDKRWMIVLPGYGETKTDVLTVAYFLAQNGFHTLRFDYSDHVGESDGEILSTTLTKMKEDILSAINYIYRRFQPTAVGAVGSSLASRVLIRAVREDDRIGILLNLACVVDLRKTLFAIYKKDHVERTICGLANGIMDVLGFQIDADHFLRSAIQDHYEDLTTTINDVSQIKIPFVIFVAENDIWVELKDVQQVFNAVASEQKSLRILKGSMHRLYENPRVVKEVLKDMVEYCARYFPVHQGYFEVYEPNLKEIGRRVRKEKERNRILHRVTKEEEREFWKNYLHNYSFIINVHDYWNLLDFIYRLLENHTSRAKILDAGCGIGNYGAFLLVKLMYRLGQKFIVAAGSPVFSLVGIDFVEEAILQAKETHARMLNEFSQKLGLMPKAGPAPFSYFLADLESELPFEAKSFDKVCCNLVISYLQNPRGAVADMMRVLKPKGRIVVTSLKPFADLSEVYRNFVRVAETEREIVEARKLLNNASRLKVKEAEGIYRFFSEEELTDILKEAGAREVETYRSFGNQANIAVGNKG